MKKSEFLKQFIELANNTSLEQLWNRSTGAPWEENSGNFSEPLGLFVQEQASGVGIFNIINYVTPSSGWQITFERQNAAVFVGFVGENELINRNVRELLEDRIDYYENEEEQNERMELAQAGADINYAEIADLLNSASWDYTYNMQRIKESDMREYIATLDNTHFTEEDVKNALPLADQTEILQEHGDMAINKFAAKYIADRVARAKVDCVYETVTFNI